MAAGQGRLEQLVAILPQAGAAQQVGGRGDHGLALVAVGDLAVGAAGLVATNTTLGRDGLADPDRWRATEAGGMSGAPLAARARKVVGFLAGRTDLPVIGVGGVLTAADGRALLDAGARLLQVYTGFVYRGPALLNEIERTAA